MTPEALEMSKKYAARVMELEKEVAALTKERDEAIYQTKVATQEHFDMEQQLAAAQAREAKLREALEQMVATFQSSACNYETHGAVALANKALERSDGH